jgi:hypothetical protein
MQSIIPLPLPRIVLVGALAIALFPKASFGQVSAPASGAPAALNHVLSQVPGGNTVGGEVREAVPRCDGYRHIDTPRMIKRLKALHANTCNYLLWNSPTDFDDLRQEFLPAAQKAGINVWTYMAPPAETHPRGKGSDPYRTNYLAWAKALATLSLRYSNLQAWVMDDFTWNLKTFTPEYVAEMQRVAHAINPQFRFFPVLHFTALSEKWVSDYGPLVDGIMCPYLDLPYNNTQRASSLEAQIQTARARFQKPLYVLFYAGRHLASPLEPTPEYVTEFLHIAFPAMRDGRLGGVVAYAVAMEPQTPHTLPNQAVEGCGRLSLAAAATISDTNDFAQASQIIHPDPKSPRYAISFWHYDQWGLPEYPKGQFAKQLLVDDAVVWECDPALDVRSTWLEGSILQGPVDLTRVLKDKSAAKLTFRLRATKTDGKPPIDVGFDRLSTIGFTLQDPGFETGQGWQISDAGRALLGALDRYEPERPQRVFKAIAKAYRQYHGQ